MALIDYAIVARYFAVVIGPGFWYRRRAARVMPGHITFSLDGSCPPA